MLGPSKVKKKHLESISDSEDSTPNTIRRKRRRAASISSVPHLTEQFKGLRLNSPKDQIIISPPKELSTHLDFQNIFNSKKLLFVMAKEIIRKIELKLKVIPTEITKINLQGSFLTPILCSMCSHLAEPMFGEEHQIWVRELLAGLMSYRNSTLILKKLINIYSHVELDYHKLNVIFIIKELIQIDDFYYGVTKSKFFEALSNFCKLITTDFNALSKKLLLFAEVKKIVLQPYKNGYYQLNLALARATPSEQLASIADILLGAEKPDFAAKTLAHDLTLITLIFCQNFNMLGFAKKGLHSSKSYFTEYDNFIDKLTNFLTTLILIQKSLLARQKIITIYILTIQILLGHEHPGQGIIDVNSAFLLHNVLGEVDRLKETFASLPQKIFKLWLIFEKSFNSLDNYADPHIPIIANQIRTCIHVKENEKYPDKYMMPGKIYLSIMGIYECLREENYSIHNLRFVTNIYDHIRFINCTNDDELYLLSLAIEPIKLVLEKNHFYSTITGEFDFGIFSKIIEIYVKNRFRLVVLYRTDDDKPDADSKGKYTEAVGDHAIILLCSWLIELIKENKISYEDGLKTFQNAGHLVNNNENYKQHENELSKYNPQQNMPHVGFTIAYHHHRRRSQSTREANKNADTKEVRRNPDTIITPREKAKRK